MKDLALWLSTESKKKQSPSPPFVPAEWISLQFYLNLEQGLRQSMANKIGTINHNASDWSTTKYAAQGIARSKWKWRQ